MKYQYRYRTPAPFSDLWMQSDGEFLTGLRFAASGETDGDALECEGKKPPVLEEVCRWLDQYFSGEAPENFSKIKLENLTDFRRRVLQRLLAIPYGQVVTYGEIAQSIARERGIPKMSARAVGHAVGSNPICIIIPCHRVIGVNGRLTGYGGGIQTKIDLLELEGVDIVHPTSHQK